MTVKIELGGSGRRGRDLYEHYVQVQTEDGAPVLPLREWIAAQRGPAGVEVDPDAVAWVVDRVYPRLAVVLDAGSTWVARRSTRGDRPSTTPDAWTVFTPGVDLAFAEQTKAEVQQLGAQKVIEAGDQAAAAASHAGVAQVQRTAAEVAAVDAAAARAAAEAAALALGATAYPLAAALPGAPAANARAYVYADPDAANLGLWFWGASGPWTKDALNAAPLQRLLEEVAERSGLIDGRTADGIHAAFADPLGFFRLYVSTLGALRDATGTLDVGGMLIRQDDATGVGITDARGFVQMWISAMEAMIGPLSFRSGDDASLAITDDRGFVAAVFAAAQSYINGMLVRADAFDGLAITDERGFALFASGPDGSYIAGLEAATEAPTAPLLYFAPKLAAAAGQSVTLYAEGLLPDRDLIGQVRLALVGESGAAVQSDLALVVQPDQLGTTAELIAAPVGGDGLDRAQLSLAVRVAPVPAVAPATRRVLMIGDSITNRQGAQFVQQALLDWGYLPEFVGTVPGSNSASNNSATGGPLGEAREGWEAGDYTYDVTDRAVPVEPGGEAVYLAMSKTDKVARNPFIRAATGSDPSSEVRNGYILDFADYAARFALVAPDLVMLGLGTNDVRDLPAAEIEASVRDDYALLFRRLRAAWPSCRILCWLPGTSRDATRDQLWRDEYIPVLRGIRLAMADTADPLIDLAPTWAMAPQLAGYTLATGTTDSVTGTRIATLSDSIHPIGGARRALFSALAAYAACAFANIL